VTAVSAVVVMTMATATMTPVMTLWVVDYYRSWPWRAGGTVAAHWVTRVR